MKFSDIEISHCFPFDYSEKQTRAGMRIGGGSPVPPLYVDKHQKHFGTLSFDEGVSFSIFYAFDIYGGDFGKDIIDFNNKFLLQSELIHVVSHPTVVQGPTAEIPSIVSCHHLAIHDRLTDTNWDPQLPGIPYVKSKIGGHPFIDNAARCGEAFREALDMGYRQLIQFDTPNPITHPFVKNFPWDPGYLHVLVRGIELGSLEFAFLIQQ